MLNAPSTVANPVLLLQLFVKVQNRIVRPVTNGVDSNLQTRSVSVLNIAVHLFWIDKLVARYSAVSRCICERLKKPSGGRA